MKNNRIAIKLMTPDNVQMRDRFYDCARQLKKTLETEMRCVSTMGEDEPRRVGRVANITEIDDVIWVRWVSNEDVMPCKSLIQVAAEESNLGNNVLVYVNPTPMTMV